MDFGLVSVLLESVIQVSAMVGEHTRRKKQRVKDLLSSTIQQLDGETVASAVDSAALASFMRGSLTAADIKPILCGPAFRGLIKEMFLVVVTDHSNEALRSVGKSMSLILHGGLKSRASDEDIDYFSAKLIEALEGACREIVDKVKIASPESLVSLQQVALLKRITSVLENVDKNFAALTAATQPGNADKWIAWISTYRTLCAKIHGYIQPPDFDNNRKIPMHDLYVLPRVSIGGAQKYHESTELDFDSFRSSVDRTILLGNPGGGKSTFSNNLATFWAKGDEGIVPFHVTLREYAQHGNEMSMLQYIELQLSSRYQHPAPEGLVEALLLSGEAAVIFDGLDELIDTTKRRSVSQTVEIFGVLYPLVKILVTSRSVGYDQARLDTEIFRVHVIDSFELDDVVEYVKKWFACQDDYNDQEAQKLAKLFIAQSESVPDLRSNPLMLSLMCIIFRGENFIPRNRPAVYEKCANLLFEKWDGHRDIVVPLEARAHVDAALKHVAHWMLLSGSADTGVSYEKLVREMAAYLNGRAFETEDDSRRAAKEFVDFCKGRAWVFSDAGTTAEGESLFTFTHRTFMEYFAAFHLTRINDTPEKLARTLLPKVAREEWDVVAQLAVQIEDKSVDKGSERVLRVMLDEPRKRSDVGRRNVLDFVARCSYFSTVPPAFVRDLTKTCIEVALQVIDTKEFTPHTSMLITPWIALLSSGVESHRATIAEVHKSELSLALGVPGSKPWRSACRMVFFGQSISWPSQETEGGLGWSSWWTMFDRLGQDYAAQLIAFCENEPAFRTDLVVAGIQEPSKAVELLKGSGATFGEIFFENGDSDFFGFKNPPFARIISFIARGPHPNGYTPPMNFIGDLADAFLREFWESVGSARGNSLTRAIAFTYIMNIRIDRKNAKNVIEAAFIILMADMELSSQLAGLRQQRPIKDEVFHSLLVSRESKTEFDVSLLAEYDFSSKIIEFVTLWSRGELSIFEQVITSDAGVDEINDLV